MEIHQKISRPDYQKLKTMVKRSIDQKLRLRNFDARNEKIETGAVVTSRRGLSGIERGKGVCYQWKAKGQCSRGDLCSFGHDGDERAKPTPKTAPSSEPPTPRGRSASRKWSLRGRSQSGKSNRQPCKNLLKGTCTKFLCDYWHPPECQFCKSESGCKFGAECPFPHWKVEDNPTKGRRSIVKDVRQLGCVSQDAELPKSVSISRKGTNILGPIRPVRFTRVALRQANIREGKGSSLNKIHTDQKFSSAQSLRRPISGRDRKTRAMRPRRRVETCQKYP